MAQTTTGTGPTLTDVTYIGRQVVKFGAIAIVVLIVGRTLLTAFVAYWKATHPEPPPPPTVGFGLLPGIKFPTNDEGTPTRYTLETATGTLPSFGDRAKVFFMPKSSLSLLSDEKAKEIASQYGFVFAPEVLDSRRYRWTKSQPLESTLEIDIQSLNFVLKTNYLSRPELLSSKKLPDGSEALDRVKSMIKSVDLMSDDLATASGEVVYLKALGGEVSEAVSFSDADYVQVDLNRTPIDDQLRMFTPEGYKGSISGIVSGNFSGDQSIVQLEYNYHPVDYSEIHTYPLRTTDSAWRLLQSGEGYIAQKGTADTAVVRQVYLGYFDSFEEQQYLQPIYVFEGDDGFLGYVPAIDPKYVQGETQ
jgi:hypothetical protein